MRASKFVLIIALAGAAALLSAAAEATPLVVANASFESPALADGTAISSSSITFASQGGYGWTYDANSSIINPNASEFSNAAGNGTPLGAAGSQVTDVTRVSGFGGIIQVLAGGDGIVGNGDDPVVTASTLYLLTVSVGHSLTRPNFGGYNIQLFARNGAQDTIVAQITDAAPPSCPEPFPTSPYFWTVRPCRHLFTAKHWAFGCNRSHPTVRFSSTMSALRPCPSPRVGACCLLARLGLCTPRQCVRENAKTAFGSRAN